MNQPLWECLRRFSAPSFPGWFLGAGSTAQTVWNLAHDRSASESVLDYDLVYFDSDRSEEAESAVADAAQSLTRDLGIKLDVKNQARVHLWYERHFGYPIEPYNSVEEAIATWPTTATAIGVRLNGRNLQAISPFGLKDIFDLVVRANRAQITSEIYSDKASRWLKLWPRLTVLPWEEGVGVPGKRQLDPTGNSGRTGS
jgi:hypothetical protein